MMGKGKRGEGSKGGTGVPKTFPTPPRETSGKDELVALAAEEGFLAVLNALDAPFLKQQL
jgi:hypothetical protein